MSAKEIIKMAAERNGMSLNEAREMCGIRKSYFYKALKYGMLTLPELRDVAEATGMTDQEWLALRKG